MLRTARCACKEASITVSGEPELHAVCHCTNCKQRTGSAFGISVYFRRTEVHEIKGSTKVYSFYHATQNHTQERHFCEKCGTTLFWHISSKPEFIGIAGGCFGEATLSEPTFSLTHAKKVNWLTLPSTLHTVLE